MANDDARNGETQPVVSVNISNTGSDQAGRDHIGGDPGQWAGAPLFSGGAP